MEAFERLNHTIDTFAARDLQVPEKWSISNEIGRYSAGGGHDLEIRKRRFNRSKPALI